MVGTNRAARAGRVLRVVGVQPLREGEPGLRPTSVHGEAGPDELVVTVSRFLMRTAGGLRAEIDAVLRPRNLTISQYACLEMLDQLPGQSTAELARGACLTRQAMSLVLRGLQSRGLITRPAAPRGQLVPNELTPAGRAHLQDASTDVRRIERRMLSSLATHEQEMLLDKLVACAATLSTTVVTTRS